MFKLYIQLSVFVLLLFGLPIEAFSVTTITFNNDRIGIYNNPFISADSNLVKISEVGTAAVGRIEINMSQHSSNVLSSSPGGGVRDEILMEFKIPVTSLSFDIGHASGVTNLDAWLRVYDGGLTPISESRINLDADTMINQVITYQGEQITSARVALVPRGSTYFATAVESIDNITFTPVH